ncbi:MAG TPA: hypothetical protein VNT56_02000 [Acidimicrobiales bacterium]|nr:hypothetical protein [Acidimicrobiales bacterium]
MSDGEEIPYTEVGQRIGELVGRLTAHDDEAVGERVTEILDWVDVFHRTGLTRMLAMVEEWRGEIFLESVAGDPVAGTLLDAYELRDRLLPEGGDTPPAPPPQPTVVQIRKRPR